MVKIGVWALGIGWTVTIAIASANPLAINDMELAVCEGQLENIFCQVNYDGRSIHDGLHP